MDEPVTGAIDCQLPCALCGGDLFGTSIDAQCPHCGGDVGRTIKIAAIDRTTMTVATDALCAGCDYNLRTLPIASLCPECSRPVVESLGAVDLQFADPAWVARVRRGLTRLLVAFFSACVLVVSLVGVAALWPAFADATPLVIAAFVIAVGVFIAISVSVFDVTAVEPDRTQYRMHKGAQIAARILVFAPVLGGLFLAIVAFRPSWVFGNLIPSLIISSGLFAGCACVAACLRTHARRVRRPGLSRLTTVLIWLCVATCGLGGLAGTLSTIIGYRVRTQMMAAQQMASATPFTQSPSTPLTSTDSNTNANAASATSPTVPPNANPPGATVAPATVATIGPSSTTGAVPPINLTAPVFPPRALIMVLVISSCGNGLLYLAAIVISIILLFKYRNLFTAPVQAATTPAQQAV
ncbi:MAG: hypothetical protein IID36_11570 [Planctomycetes bacterium]|nr:hypothetical protein [Planctomycetota bacterium]